MSAMLVSFEQQTFNDSLMFLEKARILPTNQPFKRWTMLTWSIVSAQVCMEAYLNAFISAKLPTTERQAFTDDTRNFKNKVNDYVKSRLVLPLQTNDTGWQEILNSMQLRNKIVHHKVDKEVFDELTEKNAGRAIDSCRELIKRLCQADGKKYPKWVDKTQSQVYDS